MFHVHQTGLGSLGQVKISLNDNVEQPDIRLAGFYSILLQSPSLFLSTVPDSLTCIHSLPHP